MATVAACAGFGSVCGSSLATASTTGMVALPELARYGYSASISASSTRRPLGVRAMRDALLDTARTTGMIYLILLGAEMMKIFMSRGGVPQAIAEWMVNSGLSPMMVLGILLLALSVVELGLITPPVGMNFFVIPAMAKGVLMRNTFVGVLPFFGADIVRVMVLLAFPAIVLWLPRVLSG